MSSEYFLTPVSGEFQDAILQNAREYWKALPSYERSDGTIFCVENVEYRDHIVSNNLTEELIASSVLTHLAAKRITIATFGTERDMQLYRFAEWLNGLQPIRVFDEFGDEQSLAWLRQQLSRYDKSSGAS